MAKILIKLSAGFNDLHNIIINEKILPSWLINQTLTLDKKIAYK